MTFLLMSAHHAIHHGFWWHVGHLYADATGATNESGPVYGSWSGFWGAIQPTLALTAVVFWWHHTCHDENPTVWWWPLSWFPSCWHWGHHLVTTDTGVTYRVCHKHHGGRPATITHAHILEAIRQHTARSTT